MNVNEPSDPVQIHLNGKFYSMESLKGFTGITIRQRISQPTQCELYFSLSPLLADSLGMFEPGASLSVAIGSNTLFIGNLVAVEYNYSADNNLQVFIRAYDALQSLRKNFNDQKFLEYPLDGLISSLCRHSNVQISLVSNINQAVLPIIYQFNQSDLDFLAEITYKLGVFFFLEKNKLHLFSLDTGNTTKPLNLVLGLNLFEANLEQNITQITHEVHVRSHTTSLNEGLNGISVLNSRNKLPPRNNPSKEIFGKVTESLQEFGDRSLVNLAAQAEFNRRASTEFVLRGITAGIPDLFPGRRVNVSEVVQVAAGEYILTKVDHIFDERGYRTKISTEPPHLSLPHRFDLTTYGRVIDIKDPQAKARIRVVLYAFNNLETDWVPVAMPAVSHKTGLFSLPEVGDTVIILMAESNPANSIVLGGMIIKPDDRTKNDNLEISKLYTWSTPDGNEIHIVDSNLGKGGIKLITQKGAYIQLIEDNIEIGGSRIDFKKI